MMKAFQSPRSYGKSVVAAMMRKFSRESKRKHWTEPMNLHPEVAEAFKVACAPTPRTRKPSVFGKTSLGHAWYPRLWHGPRRVHQLDPKSPGAQAQLQARPSRHARGVPGPAGSGPSNRTKPFEEVLQMPGGQTYARRHDTLYRVRLLAA